MEETVIRKILKSEFAQVSAIVVVIWFFMMNVILPIANIESQVANIQATLVEMKSTNANFDARITSNSNAIIILQQEINSVLGIKK